MQKFLEAVWETRKKKQEDKLPSRNSDSTRAQIRPAVNRREETKKMRTTGYECWGSRSGEEGVFKGER